MISLCILAKATPSERMLMIPANNVHDPDLMRVERS